MPIRVTVKMPDVRKLSRRIERAARACTVIALPAADLQLGNEAAFQIESEGAHLGTKWPALKPATVQARKRRIRYYRHASGGGPEHPMVLWTRRIWNEVKKAGRLAKGRLTVTREYVSTSDQSEPTRNRLVLTHYGDPTVNRPARPIFFIENGNRMARGAFRIFASVFGRHWPTEMGRP